jgi:cell division protein ZapA (FtsZ GTPase activity inhibitor)
MDNKKNQLEFDVLGFKVRFKPEDENSKVPPSKTVGLVRQEADSIRKKFPQLDSGQIATLAALKIAADYLNLSEEYRENVDKFHSTAKDALQVIEDISRTSV